MPTIDDLFPDLCKARVFSVVDVKNGFWHVQLDDESRKLTTFAHRGGVSGGRECPLALHLLQRSSNADLMRHLKDSMESGP